MTLATFTKDTYRVENNCSGVYFADNWFECCLYSKIIESKLQTFPTLDIRNHKSKSSAMSVRPFRQIYLYPPTSNRDSLRIMADGCAIKHLVLNSLRSFNGPEK